jgi:hypothetical protein
MGGYKGITRLALFLVVASFAFLPQPGRAADQSLFSWGTRHLPLLAVEAKNPLEAQMLGEKPFQALPSWPGKALFGASLAEQGTTLRLPSNLELRISFLYDREHQAFTPERPINSYLLFKYSMDYRLLPNLQVGLNGFLYRPASDSLAYQQRFGHLMGLGPGIKYDLGRWSFTFKSQLATGDRGEGLENWFRVWYAF